MHHDQRANQPCRHSPTRSPAKFLLAFAVLKLDATGARKVLAEKMRRTGLDRLPVLHHRFDRQRLHRAGETLALGFFPGENRDREMLAHEPFVKIEN